MIMMMIMMMNIVNAIESECGSIFALRLKTKIVIRGLNSLYFSHVLNL